MSAQVLTLFIAWTLLLLILMEAVRSDRRVLGLGPHRRALNMGARCTRPCARPLRA